MRALRSRMILGAAFALISSAALAQSFVKLLPVQFLDQNAGCFAQRCLMGLEDFDGTSALTSNTGPGLAIHVRSQRSIWTVQQAVTNPDYPNPPSAGPPAQQQQDFGFPSAVQGSSLIVRGTSPRYNMKDVIYVFRRSSGRWSHIQTLTLQKPKDYDRTLVFSIALSSDTAIVGGVRSQDAGQVPDFVQFDFYRRNADGTFHRRGGFKPPMAPQSAFQSQLELSGNFVAIGDPFASNESGRVYIYEYGSGGWVLRRTLSPPGAVAKGHFGDSIGLDGGTIAVAEPARQDVRPEYNGVVHIYARNGTQWPRVQSLSAPIDPKLTGYEFGRNLALSGTRLFVGKGTNPFTDDAVSFGYLYERRNQWLPVAELDAENGDFNTAVQMSGSLALVNANDFANSTPVYVFQLPALDTLPALTTETE